MTDTAETPKPTRAKTAKAADAPELNIFQRVAAISAEAGAMAPESKGGVPFAFRGIDGTVAHLTPFLNKYGVFLAPNVEEKEVRERELYDKQGTATGRIVKTTDLVLKWDVYGPDGYGFSFSTAGLADDFADRSTAQAHSVAYRIALLQLFHLPTHTREPEETGQDVLNAAEAGGPAPRAAKAVEAAKAASAPPAANATRLQQEAKALGRKLGKESADLNALGMKISGKTNVDDWFHDVAVMTKVVETLKAEDAAK